MDGEQRTTRSVITPEIDTSRFEAQADRMGSRFAGTIAEMAKGSQNLGKNLDDTTKKLAGSSSAFDRLAGQMVAGYRDALAYANAIQQVNKYALSGKDTLELSAGVIAGLSARFRVATVEAKNLALAMGAGKNALNDYGIAADTAKSKLISMMAARDTPPPRPPPFGGGVPQAYVAPAATDRQRQVLASLAEGRRPGEDTFGLATLGRDRFFGNDRGAAQVIRNLQARSLVDQNLNLTGSTAYGLAGVTPPPGAPGTGLSGFQLHTALQNSIQQQRIAADPIEQRARAQTAASFGPPILQPPTDQQHSARQAELDTAFREFDRLRQSFGLVTNAAVRYADQLERITSAYNKGAITAREAARLQSVASVRTGEYVGTETSATLGVQRQINEAVGIRPGFGVGLDEQGQRISLPPGPDLVRQGNAQAAFGGPEFDAYTEQRLQQAALERQQAALAEQGQRQTAQANAAAQQRLAAAPLPVPQAAAATNAAIGGAFGPASATQFEQAANQVKAANDELRASYDPVFASSQRYAAELKEVEANALAAGASQEQLAAATAAVTARFAAANQPLQGAYAQQQAAAKAAVVALEADRRAVDETFRISKEYEEQWKRIRNLEAAGPTNGGITPEHAARLDDQNNAKFKKTVEDADKATKEAGKAGASGLEGLKFATAGATREFLVLGHEVVAGNYTRILPSLIVLAERMGGLRELIKIAWAAFLTPIGLIVGGIVAVAGALAFMAFRGEQAQERMLALQNTLRGTRDDFVAMQHEVDAASRHLAATTPIGHQEARASASQIVENPSFQGNQQQLESLVQTAFKLQLTIGGDLAAATKILVQGFDDAGKAAQELSDKHFKGLDQTVVDYIKHVQQQQGVQAAFEALRKIIDRTTVGAQENLTHLQQSWQDFEKLLTSDSEGVFHAAATNIANALGVVLDEINDLIKAWQSFLHVLDDGKGPVVPPGFSLYPWSNTPLSPTGERPTAAQGNNLTGFGHSGPGGGFTTFAAPEESITAAIRQLQINQDTHGQLTIAQQIGGVADPRTGQLVHGYSPAGENGAANTQAYIQQLAKAAGIDPNAPFNTHDQALVTKVITALATHESGHTIDQTIIDKGVSAAFQGTPTGATSPSGLGTNQLADAKREAELNAAELSKQRALNLANQAFLQKQIDAEQALVRKGTEAGQAAGQTPEQIAARPDVAAPAAAAAADIEKLGHLKGAYIDLRTEIEQNIHQLQLQQQVQGAEAGAAQKLAEADRQLDEAARKQTGSVATQAEHEKARSIILQGLSADLARLIDTEARGLEVSQLSISALEKGGDAIVEFDAKVKAATEALAFGKRGSEAWTAAFKELTAANIAANNAASDVAAAKDIHKLEQENEQIQLQAQLIGASNEQRARELAILQRRQAYDLKPGEPASPEQQRDIDFAGNIAAFKEQTNEAAQGMQELEQVSQGALDKVSSALTEPLKRGETAWTRFGDVVNGVIGDITKELVKLAIINPILNSAFGGHRPTVEDIGKKPVAPAIPPLAETDPTKALARPALSPQATFSAAVDKFAAAVEHFSGGAGSPAAKALNDNATTSTATHHAQEIAGQNQPAPDSSSGAAAALPEPPIPPGDNSPPPPLPLVTPGATPPELEAPAITPGPVPGGPIPWLLRQLGIDTGTSDAKGQQGASLPLDPATGAVQTVSAGYVNLGGETAKQAGLAPEAQSPIGAASLIHTITPTPASSLPFKPYQLAGAIQPPPSSSLTAAPAANDNSIPADLLSAIGAPTLPPIPPQGGAGNVVGDLSGAVSRAATSGAAGILGGLPIDPATGALMVVSVGQTLGGGLITPKNPLATTSGNDASNQLAAAAGDGTQVTSGDTSSVPSTDSSGGGLLGQALNALTGGGGGLLGAASKFLFNGGLWDSIFGKDFFKNGGLIGSLFGSGNGPGGVIDSSTSTFDTGMSGTSIVPDSALGTSADPFAVGPDVTSDFSGGVGDSFVGAPGIGDATSAAGDAASSGSGFFSSIGDTLSSGASSIGNFFSNLFANGGAFGPGLHEFTNQVVSSPTHFSFASGTGPAPGLMGEAGPEAIMPLMRHESGQLGVRAFSGGDHFVLPLHRHGGAGPLGVSMDGAMDAPRRFMDGGVLKSGTWLFEDGGGGDGGSALPPGANDPIGTPIGAPLTQVGEFPTGQTWASLNVAAPNAGGIPNLWQEQNTGQWFSPTGALPNIDPDQMASLDKWYQNITPVSQWNPFNTSFAGGGFIPTPGNPLFAPDPKIPGDVVLSPQGDQIAQQQYRAEQQEAINDKRNSDGPLGGLLPFLIPLLPFAAVGALSGLSALGIIGAAGADTAVAATGATGSGLIDTLAAGSGGLAATTPDIGAFGAIGGDFSLAAGAGDAAAFDAAGALSGTSAGAVGGDFAAFTPAATGDLSSAIGAGTTADSAANAAQAAYAAQWNLGTAACSASSSSSGFFGGISNWWNQSWLGQIINSPAVKTLRLLSTLKNAVDTALKASQPQQPQQAALGGVFTSPLIPAQVLHEGGMASWDNPTRMVDPSFYRSPYTNNLGSDEFAAILQKGERVLTANTNDRLEGMMGTLASGGDDWRPQQGGHTFHITVPGAMDKDASRRTGQQIATQIGNVLVRQNQRGRTSVT